MILNVLEVYQDGVQRRIPLNNGYLKSTSVLFFWIWLVFLMQAVECKMKFFQVMTGLNAIYLRPKTTITYDFHFAATCTIQMLIFGICFIVNVCAHPLNQLLKNHYYSTYLLIISHSATLG